MRTLKNIIKRGISCPRYVFNRKGPVHEDGYRILLYHSVGPRKKDDYMGLKITQEEFLKQMEFLKQNRFMVCSLGGLIEKMINNIPIQPKSVAITFDDGYRDVLNHAVPILKEFGYTATVFMTTDYIGARMQHEAVVDYWKAWPFLSVEELQFLDKNGFDVESHSVDFESLKMLEKREAVRKITNSKACLEKRLTKKISLFAYPGGGTSVETRSILKEAGFKGAVCSIPGYNGTGTDLFVLRRTEISGWDRMLDFKLKLFGYCDWVRHVKK